MKRMFSYLSGVLVLSIGMLVFASAKAAETPTGPRSKIAVFNIAKVLRGYNKANQQGKEIAEKRAGYLTQINTLRNKINDKNKELGASAPTGKDRIQDEIYQLNAEIDKLDRTASKLLSEMSNDTIVRVYKEIQGLVKDVADANGFDMIMAYPDASDEKEKGTPLVAQLMLQTPALIPFHVAPSMDITDYIVTNLNKRYPAPPVDPASLPGGTSSVPSTGGITPTSAPIVTPTGGTMKIK